MASIHIGHALWATGKITDGCCCCWVASVVSDSVRPHRPQPTRLPIPGILQARTLEWVAISFSNAGNWKVKVKSLIRVQLFATPWTAAHQAPPSMGFSRQEYWSGVPLPDSIYVKINMLYTQRRPVVAQLVKNPPAMQETRVQSLGQEDLLEKKGQPTTEFLPGKSHGERSLEGYSPWPRRVRHDLGTKPPHTHGKMLALLPLWQKLS